MDKQQQQQQQQQQLAPAPDVAGLLPLEVRRNDVAFPGGSGGDAAAVLLRGLGAGVTAARDAPAHLLPRGAVLLDAALAGDGDGGGGGGDGAPAAAAAAVFALGDLAGDAFTAVARLKLPWSGPHWATAAPPPSKHAAAAAAAAAPDAPAGGGVAALPNNIQLLLVRLGSNGGGEGEAAAAATTRYALLLPLLPSGCIATLQPGSSSSSSGSSGRRRGRHATSSSSSSLALRVDSGNADVRGRSWPRALLVAAGTDPYALLDALVPAAAAIGTGRATARRRADKRVPDAAGWLGWCTWDAFYHSVSARGLVQGLESLRAAGTPPRWLIIDDGWQRTGLPHDEEVQRRRLQGPPEPPPPTTMRPPAAAGAGVSSPSAALSPSRRFPSTSSLAAAAAADQTGVGLGGSAGAFAPQQQQHEQQLPLTMTTLPPPPPPTPARRLGWLLRAARSLLLAARRALLRGVAAVADRFAWWQLLLAALRSRLLHGALVRLLLRYNESTSEHAKRLLSNQFNGKFATLEPPLPGAAPELSSGRAPDPAAVAALIGALKREYGLRRVYCWHALLGYWSGVSVAAVAAPAPAPAAEEEEDDDANGGGGGVAVSSPPATPPPSAAAAAAWAAAAAASPAASPPPTAASAGGYAPLPAVVAVPRPSDAVVALEPPTAWSHMTIAGLGLPAGGPAPLFAALHSYLAACGVDGVKVDVQSSQLELAASAAGVAPNGVARLSAEWHAALEASVAGRFPGNELINCMSHSTADLFACRDSLLARASDDFYPKLAASHTAHVAACAFNALLLSPILLPDWDMFHSRHRAALLHATARMISGGPVYVSDKPGRHDPALLRRLALPGGRLAQPRVPGRPTRDCLFDDPTRGGRGALKVFSLNACGGVVAAFNLQGAGWDRAQLKFRAWEPEPAPVAVRVRPRDVEGLVAAAAAGGGGAFAGGDVLPGLQLMCGSDGSGSSSSRGGGKPATAAAKKKGGGAAAAAPPQLRATGAFALYVDGSRRVERVVAAAAAAAAAGAGAAAAAAGDSSGGGGGDDFLELRLPAASSEVITVAPLLALGSAGEPRTVRLAVVGFTDLLNPGGGVLSVAPTRPTDCEASPTDGGWVLAAGAAKGGRAAAAASPQQHQQGDNDDDDDACAEPLGVGVALQLRGCGPLLVHCDARPVAVRLDGVHAAAHSYDSATGALVVEVPPPEAAERVNGWLQVGDKELEHALVIGF